jgi:hypothetical protein
LRGVGNVFEESGWMDIETVEDDEDDDDDDEEEEEDGLEEMAMDGDANDGDTDEDEDEEFEEEVVVRVADELEGEEGGEKGAGSASSTLGGGDTSRRLQVACSNSNSISSQ